MLELVPALEDVMVVDVVIRAEFSVPLLFSSLAPAAPSAAISPSPTKGTSASSAGAGGDEGVTPSIPCALLPLDFHLPEGTRRHFFYHLDGQV